MGLIFKFVFVIVLLIGLSLTDAYDDDYDEEIVTPKRRISSVRRITRTPNDQRDEPVIYSLPSDVKLSKAPLFFPGTGMGSGLFGQSIFGSGGSTPARQQSTTILAIPTPSQPLTASASQQICCACPAMASTSGAIIASPSFSTTTGRLTTTGAWPSFPTVSSGQFIALPFSAAQHQTQQQQAELLTDGYNDGMRKARRLAAGHSNGNRNPNSG